MYVCQSSVKSVDSCSVSLYVITFGVLNCPVERQLTIDMQMPSNSL